LVEQPRSSIRPIGTRSEKRGAAQIPLLATYLGHVEVRELYWYLSAVPELMSIVAQRFAHFTAHDPAGAP
jgi:hypothetical protein